MSQVLTEGTNLAVVVETTLGAATPPTTGWYNLQPNSYGDVGASLKKLPRTPISKNRQRRKPMLVDLDSMLPFELDVTKDAIDIFGDGMFMGAFKHSGNTGVALFRPTAVTATGYTVAASGALTTRTLVYARGFSTAANNGLKITTASTATEIKAAGLTAEPTPPANVTVEVAGWRGTVSDITMDGSGNLTSTVDDFSTMGLYVGQWIWVGGTTGGANAFLTHPEYRGFARIKTIAANLLTLERRSWTVGASDAGTGQAIDLYFTRWVRNTAIDSADFLRRSYAFELTYPDLSSVGVPEYEYLVGNMIDEFTWNIPLTSKVTANVGLVGMNTQDPTASRKTGPSTALNPLCQLGLSTATDILRLRVRDADDVGIATDIKSIKLTFKNNVEPEKELAVLGASLMNVGVFEVMVEMDVIFTSDQVIKAIRDNRTCALDIGLRNGDFGLLLDVSSMTIDEGDRKFETNKSVVISTKTTGFQDDTLAHTASMSLFAFLPSS